MTLGPGATPPAKTMKSTDIHCFATWADVRLTGFAPQSMGNGNPYCVIRQPATYTEAMGGACSQSPEWGDAAAWLCQRHQPLLRIPGLGDLSHAFWICCSSSAGRIEPDRDDHLVSLLLLLLRCIAYIAEMRPIVTDVAHSVVCVSVCWASG